MGGSCRLLPHGGFSLIPTVLSTMAWIASVFQDGCDYAIIRGPVVQTISDDNDAVPWVEVGYAAYRVPSYNIESSTWEVEYGARCMNYDTERFEMDAAWKTGKAFAFLALVMGGGGTLFLWFSSCCVFSKATWKWAGHEVLLACIFQALAFLWFLNSACYYQENSCSLSWGSKADVVACVFWAIAALAIFCKYPEPYDNMQFRARETTSPEIRIGSREYQQQSPSNRQRSRNYGSPTGTATTVSSPTSVYESNSQIVAALPLAGDATATMYDHDEFARKELRDVEVL